MNFINNLLYNAVRAGRKPPKYLQDYKNMQDNAERIFRKMKSKFLIVVDSQGNEKKETADIVNAKIKLCHMEGLDEKFVFTSDDEQFLLSTVDVIHGNEEVVKNNPWISRYETMLFKNPIINDSGYIIDLGDEVWCIRYLQEEEAIKEHKKLVKKIKKGHAAEIINMM